MPCKRFLATHSFENVRLFKGFGPSDEKTFYLTASVQLDQKDGLTAEVEKQRLEKELKVLLGFYVGITREERMEKGCLDEINQMGGSVNLSEVVEKATLKEKLERYFGKNWQFNIVDPYADRKPKPPTPEMLAFPKMIGMGRGRGTHPVFASATKESRILMMSIEKIIENIDTMQALFKAHGFENVRLFKGFGPLDEKTFYLTVSLQAGQKDGLAAEAKKQGLEKELKTLFGFYVGITREEDMEKDCLTEINQPRGSVNLSEVVEKTTLREKLEGYFGKDWQFDIVDPYADRKPKLPTPEMLAFPKMIGMGRGMATHPVFVSGTKELPIESVKKVEDSVNELTSKFSAFTTDELILLREKLLQSMDQKLSELQIQKTV